MYRHKRASGISLKLNQNLRNNYFIGFKCQDEIPEIIR